MTNYTRVYRKLCRWPGTGTAMRPELFIGTVDPENVLHWTWFLFITHTQL